MEKKSNGGDQMMSFQFDYEVKTVKRLLLLLVNNEIWKSYEH